MPYQFRGHRASGLPSCTPASMAGSSSPGTPRWSGWASWAS